MLIDEPKFSEILPESLRSDEKILAAAKAVDDELKKLSDAIKHVLHLPRLDELDSDVLDHLAWQYHVDNYSAEFSEVIKRKMIRESIYLHKIKGTPEAVLLALKPFSENPELEEWWQYAGEPYFFKLVLHNLVDVGDDGEELLRTIYDAKNVRSWLELITFDFSDEEAHGLYHGALEQEGGEEFTDLSGMDESEDGGIYHAIGELDAGFEFTDLDFSAQTDSAICRAVILSKKTEVIL